MKWLRCITLLAMIASLGGCSLGKGFVNSFKNQPGQRPMTLPSCEWVPGTRYQVCTRMMEGQWRPRCDLPDASNSLSCTFTYGWFEKGGIYMETDAYRTLNMPMARAACSDALWSAGPDFSTEWYVQTCAFNLMHHRWVFDNERAEYEEPTGN